MSVIIIRQDFTKLRTSTSVYECLYMLLTRSLFRNKLAPFVLHFALSRERHSNALNIYKVWQTSASCSRLFCGRPVNDCSSYLCLIWGYNSWRTMRELLRYLLSRIKKYAGLGIYRVRPFIFPKNYPNVMRCSAIVFPTYWSIEKFFISFSLPS